MPTVISPTNRGHHSYPFNILTKFQKIPTHTPSLKKVGDISCVTQPRVIKEASPIKTRGLITFIFFNLRVLKALLQCIFMLECVPQNHSAHLEDPSRGPQLQLKVKCQKSEKL